MPGSRYQTILLLILFFNIGHLVNARPTSPAPATKRTSFVPGKCVVFPPGECQSDIPTDECTNDQQCQEIYPDFSGLKCCTNYCGIRVCDLPFLKSQPFEMFTEYVCPAIAEEPAECPVEEDFLKECTQDSECEQIYPGEGYICCNDGCGDTYCEQPDRRTVKRYVAVSR